MTHLKISIEIKTHKLAKSDSFWMRSVNTYCIYSLKKKLLKFSFTKIKRTKSNIQIMEKFKLFFVNFLSIFVQLIKLFPYQSFSKIFLLKLQIFENVEGWFNFES